MQVHISEVQNGDRLARDLFTRSGILILSGETVLSDQHISSLFSHQFDYIEIYPSRKSGTATPGEPRVMQASTAVREAYQASCEQVLDLFDHASKGKPLSPKKCEDSAASLIKNTSKSKDLVSLLLALDQTPHEYKSRHSTESAILTHHFAKWLGWSDEDAMTSGIAGYLHDIGMSCIHPDLWQKPGKLMPFEYERVKSHTLIGYHLLADAYPDSPISLAALEHHERQQGNGYPHGKSHKDIHIISKITAIVDTYNAMILNRAHQPKQDLFNVLRTLHDLSFSDLDPELTSVFIKKMLPSFIGKKALLSSGDEGTIIMHNQGDLFRPLIQSGSKFLDLSKDRSNKIIAIKP